jgi:hypothetical protein
MLFLAVGQKYLHGWKAEMSRFYIYKLILVEKTVDTHKILINAIKFYVCLQEI